MKSIIPVIFLLFSSNYILSQVPENILWGEKHSYGKIALLGHTDFHYYLLSYRKKAIKLYQYNLKHQVVSNTELEMPKKKLRNSRIQMINTSTNDFIIVSSYDKALDKTLVQYALLNEDGKVGKDLNDLFSFDYKKAKFWKSGFKGTDKKNADLEGIKWSPDSTKILFANTVGDQDSRKDSQKERYLLKVFDSNLEKLWEKEFKPPFADKDFLIEQVQITNSNEVLISVKVEKQEDKKFETPNFDYYIYYLTNKQENVFSKKINLKTNYPHSFYLSPQSDGSYFAYGYYFGNNKKKSLLIEQGVFTIKYNSEFKEEFSKQYPFEEDLLKQIKKENKLGNARKKIEGNYSGKLFIEDAFIDTINQFITVISEYRFLKNSSYTYTSGDYKGRTEEKTSEHSKFLLIQSLDFEGNLQWTIPIIKSDNKGNAYSKKHYFSIKRNGNLFLLFNNDIVFNTKNNLVCISPQGKIIYNIKPPSKEKIKGNIIPRGCVPIGNNKVLIKVTKQFSFKFGILNLP